MSNLWRTLAEAAEWLSAETGKTWSASDVLRAAIESTPEGDYVPIVFPAGAAAMRGELHGPKGEQAPSYIGRGTLLSPSKRPAEALLILDVTGVGATGLYRHEGYGATFYPLIEITLDDLRIAEQTLRGLVSTEAPAAGASPKESAGPAPLSTGDMAAVLAGVEERTEAGWRKMLADCPKWLAGARASKGAPGIVAATWNPVTVALALQESKVPTAKLSAIFKHPLAEQWVGEWARAKQAAADYGI
jgi:hypothetical protein